MAKGKRKASIRSSKRARAIFLTALAEGYSVSAAAERCGVARKSVYTLRDEDPDFATEWAEALDRGADLLEDELRTRVVDGLLKPVFHNGKPCGDVREKSDVLLIFALKARRPQVYRDNVHHTADASLASAFAQAVLQASRPPTEPPANSVEALH